MNFRNFPGGNVVVAGMFLAGFLSLSTAQTMSVQDAQTALKSKGYFDSTIDGIYGPKTREAITRYQREQGLKVTGRMDAETSAHLGGSSATQEAAGAVSGAAKEAKRATTKTGSDSVSAAGSEASSSAKETGKSAWKEMKGAVGGDDKKKK